MTKQQILENVNSILNDKFETADLDPQTHLLGDDYGLDSLDVIELAMEAEKQMNTSISDELVEEWKEMTPDQVAQQIEDNCSF